MNCKAKDIGGTLGNFSRGEEGEQTRTQSRDNDKHIGSPQVG